MKKVPIYFLAFMLLMGSCYPDGPEYYEEYDLVYTNYDEDFSFDGNVTYAMPDSVVIITGDLIEGKDPEFIREPFNSQIINGIEANMGSLGWTRVQDPGEADLVLMPASWSNTTVYYWYDYWCWYYPWYCGWGWYYPGYVTSYTTGTLVMTLVAMGEDYIEPTRVWTGAINGLLSGSFNVQRVTNGIDQAFEQSNYLDIN